MPIARRDLIDRTDSATTTALVDAFDVRSSVAVNSNTGVHGSRIGPANWLRSSRSTFARSRCSITTTT